MKYVVLSFDDARRDFYANALPVLRAHGLTATLNVITKLVGRRASKGFRSGNGEFMTWEEIDECLRAGIEVACHSANHTNDPASILRGCAALREHLPELEGKPLGFASPGSEIAPDALSGYELLVASGELAYIRSGYKLRRDGRAAALLYLLARSTRNPFLFRVFHRNSAVDARKAQSWFYPSVSCCQDTTLPQILSLLRHLREGKALILTFHSILRPTDPGWGQDKWFNSVEELENICGFLKEAQDIQALSLMDLHRMRNGKG